MSTSSGQPPPGGGNNGPRLPFYMDPEGNHGEIRILRIQGLMQEDNTRCPLPKYPVLIRKSVQNHLKARIEGGFPEAQGATYALKVRSADHYLRLQQMKELANGFRVEVIPHPSLNTTRCVITCRDAVKESDEDLMYDLEEQGVKEIRRITRKDGAGRANTASIIVTCHGTCAPEYLNIGYNRCGTRPYYPSPMQCFNCWAFGHTKMRCRVGKPICGTCSGDHPQVDQQRCNAPTFCGRCNTNQHAISHRSCPIYQRENEIQRIKVDRGVSYPDARKMFEQCTGSNSYASVANEGTQSALAEMGRKIDDLANIVREKDAIIAQLQAALQLAGVNNPSTVPTATIPTPIELPTNAFQEMLKAQAAHFEGMMQKVVSVLATTQQKVQQLETIIQGQNSGAPQRTVQEPITETIIHQQQTAGSLDQPQPILPTIPVTNSEETHPKTTNSDCEEAEEEVIALTSDFPASSESGSDSTATPDISPNQKRSPKTDTPMPQQSRISPSTPKTAKRPIQYVDANHPPQNAPASKVQRALLRVSTPTSTGKGGKPIGKHKQT